MICDQFVDRTQGRESTFYDGPQTTHVSAADPFCRDLSATLAEAAREEGIPVSEEMITRDQLYLADEAFLTGTAAEVTPIREVDDRRLGDGTMGPITKRLQQRYFDVVKGSDTSHPEWLTRV